MATDVLFESLRIHFDCRDSVKCISSGNARVNGPVTPERVLIAIGTSDKCNKAIEADTKPLLQEVQKVRRCRRRWRPLSSHARRDRRRSRTASLQSCPSVRAEQLSCGSFKRRGGFSMIRGKRYALVWGWGAACAGNRLWGGSSNSGSGNISNSCSGNINNSALLLMLPLPRQWQHQQQW